MRQGAAALLPPALHRPAPCAPPFTRCVPPTTRPTSGGCHAFGVRVMRLWFGVSALLAGIDVAPAGAAWVSRLVHRARQGAAALLPPALHQPRSTSRDSFDSRPLPSAFIADRGAITEGGRGLQLTDPGRTRMSVAARHRNPAAPTRAWCLARDREHGPVVSHCVAAEPRHSQYACGGRTTPAAPRTLPPPHFTRRASPAHFALALRVGAWGASARGPPEHIMRRLECRLPCEG